MKQDRERLPPNQALAAPGKWPVVGERAPRQDDAPWTLRIEGEVAHPQCWSLKTLKEDFALQERILDIHCVTRWSRLDVRFEGIPLRALLEVCQPTAEARFLQFMSRSAQGHHTSLPLQDALQLDVLVAFSHEGQPLEPIHGGPIRTVVPGRYFYKSLKWLERIEVLCEDRLGTWEQGSGYHNEANPWKEQRYITSSFSRKQLARFLSQKDFSHQEVLSLQAEQMELSSLMAHHAQLRNANFRGARLHKADFQQANLSNAHFYGADLREADLRGADVEGADFSGADLRGADFSGASLFGVTFGAEVDGVAQDVADIDASTRFSSEGLGQLTPFQRRLVQAL